MGKQQRAIKDMAAALAYAEELLPNDVVVMNGAAVGRWLLEQTAQGQAPVAWMCEGKPHLVKQRRLSINGGGEFPNQTPLYALPQTHRQFDWVDLSVEDEKNIHDEAEGSVSCAIELTIAKLREKNGF